MTGDAARFLLYNLERNERNAMFVNQNSLLLLLLIVLGGTVWWANQSGWTIVQFVVLAVVVLGFVAMGVYARRTATSDIPTILKGGKPVLVEYYSEY
jgi:hypothetical protein